MTNTLSPAVWAALHRDCKSLSLYQQQQLLIAADQADRCTRALFRLLFFSGCRLSEALALRRDHIDSERQFVVLITLKQRGQEPLRAIPLPPDVIADLLALPVSGDGRLFLFSRWTARRLFQPIFTAARLSGRQASTRSLRHAFQDRAIQCALPSSLRAVVLGHTTTVNRAHYGQLIGYELTPLLLPTWTLPLHQAVA